MQAGCTVGELAAAVTERSRGRLKAQLRGAAERRIDAVAPLGQAQATHLSFLANRRYRAAALGSGAGALVLSPADAAAIFATVPEQMTVIECTEPYAWFAFAAQTLAPAPVPQPGVDGSARVAPSARVDAGARIEAYAVIEEGAQIGAGAWIGAGCFVGAGCSIGAGTRLYPGARLLADTRIGARGIIHSGAVLGADGFGFAPLDGAWIKIPQTGRVVVGDDVEIGANTTIDRGAMGDTVIEDGVIMDNQIQIGHNCRIGAHTAIAGCVGVAGSVTIGERVQIGGAAMIAGHLSIARGTVVGGGTLVSRTIPAPDHFTGVFPIMKHRDWEHNAAALRHLDELRARIRALEAQLRQLAPSDPNPRG